MDDNDQIEKLIIEIKESAISLEIVFFELKKQHRNFIAEPVRNSFKCLKAAVSDLDKYLN